ncbi:hypothetical protein MHYP_G00001230 [Metynnis hypsauchen]
MNQCDPWVLLGGDLSGKTVDSPPKNGLREADCFRHCSAAALALDFGGNIQTLLGLKRMSSEEKILDPSDKGPSPLLGGSVATPTGSPASTDKRPRGRPRKDAPSAAAQPAPTPRQRKK